MNGSDLGALEAIAQVRHNGGLQKVTQICLENRTKKSLFSSEKLASLVREFKDLVVFSLSWAELTDADIVLLANAAEEKAVLQRVSGFSLSECELGKAHPQNLARLIANLPLLIALKLHKGLTNGHVKAMIPVVEQGRLGKLTRLDFSDNKELTNPKLLVALAKALQKTSPGFNSLALRNIGLTEEGWTLLLGELKSLVSR